jgi:Tol biopolymer transport system component
MHFVLASDRGITEVTDGVERVITAIEPGGFALDPALSPDGKQVAFVLQPPVAASPGGSIDFGSDLYVVDRAGGKPRLLLKHGAVGEFIRTPAWLTGGKLLVTVRGRSDIGGFDLHILHLDPGTGAKQRLASNAIDAVVSPDGAAAAFISIDDDAGSEALVLADTSLAGPKSIAGTDQHLALISAVAWSPDGTKLVFAAIDTNQPLATPILPGGAGPGTTQHPFAQDVWLINRDGTGLHRLVELADNMPSLGWSRDGAYVYSLGVTGFWRIDVATGERAQLDYAGAIGQIVWLAP